MTIESPIPELVHTLLEGGSPEKLATEVGVSPASVKRWASGVTVPRARQEGRLRELAAMAAPDGVPANAGGVSLDTALSATLGDIREALHRRGRLSSRGEAVDEIAKLLLAHVHEVENGRPGLGAVAQSDRPAASLRACVAQAYRDRLPDDLSHELQPSDLALRLGDGEDALALDLCDAFTGLSGDAVRSALGSPLTADLLNGIFGTFLADSFADERSMGQYLTPTEVVDAMVSIGFSLAGDAVDKWLAGAADAGRIIDPSCGVGSFLLTAARRLISMKSERDSGPPTKTWLSTLMSEQLIGVDKSERMIRLAITNFALLGTHAVPLHHANALARTGSDGRLMNQMEGTAALILTNPPFGAEFAGTDIEQYRMAHNWASASKSKIDSELLFAERYLDWLAEDGVALAIVPDSILTNRGLFSDLRRALSDRVTVEAVVSLPPATFGAAGTTTKTSILAVRKGRQHGARAYVALCHDIGFDVETRASLRQKVRHERNDLLTVQREICQPDITFGRCIVDLVNHDRWDAWFHASLPPALERALEAPRMDAVWVADVATLVTERVNPQRSGEPSFRYIEISDVDGPRLVVAAKPTPTSDAPTRARKPVRAGDVLVSTVRPERRAVGVVQPADDGAVCSTGFAVLRPHCIHPFVLAALLRSEFVTAQLMRHNMGVSYPAIDEACVPDLLLPLRRGANGKAEQAATKIQETLAAYRDAQDALVGAIDGLVAEAMGAP